MIHLRSSNVTSQHVTQADNGAWQNIFISGPQCGFGISCYFNNVGTCRMRSAECHLLSSVFLHSLHSHKICLSIQTGWRLSMTPLVILPIWCSDVTWPVTGRRCCSQLKEVISLSPGWCGQCRLLPASQAHQSGSRKISPSLRRSPGAEMPHVTQQHFKTFLQEAPLWEICLLCEHKYCMSRKTPVFFFCNTPPRRSLQKVQNLIWIIYDEAAGNSPVTPSTQRERVGTFRKSLRHYFECRSSRRLSSDHRGVSDMH